MKKIKWTMLVISLMILLTFTACNKESDAGLPKSIKIGTIRVPNDKTVAYELGFLKEYFEDKGIKVELIFFDSGTAANVAFASGELDFAGMGYTNAVVALNKNIDVELIWIHEVLGANEALVVKKDSNIKSVDDLKGKTIATPFSSTSHYSLMKALEEKGMSARDIKLLDMNTEDILAAWKRGDLDGTYTWEPTLSEIKKTGQVLLDSEVMATKGVTTVNIELVNKVFSKKYPELVVDYLRALNKAQEVYKSEPEKAIQAAAKHLELDEATVKTQMSGTIWLTAEEQLTNDYLGTDDKPGNFRDTFMETAKFLMQEKKVDKLPSMDEIDDFINTGYAEEVVK